MKKITKANKKAFTKAAIQILSDCGFKSDGDKIIESYILSTGKNTVMAMPDRGEYCYSVFFRFDKPYKDLGNPNSGKCNFTCNGDLIEVIDLLKYHIDKIVAKIS